MRGTARWTSAALLLVVLLAGGAPTQEPSDGAKGSWREARRGYRFRFPRDHAAHPEYRIEWWYYTGNLETAAGRRFGYQLTFFRSGIVREPKIPSRWALRDLHLAHFAVSDLEAEKFHAFERTNRSGVGWAGAREDSYRVWNEDWEARLAGKKHVLRAKQGDVSIALELTPLKPPAVHGKDGISRKGSSPGNASHYYSITRLETAGTLRVGGTAHRVTGLSWMDHEFGTSFLEEEQVGWDWFSVQLEDGRDVMLFQMRRRDGSRDSHSSGTLVDRAGRAHPLPPGSFRLEPGRRWRSPASRAEYPLEWTLSIPAHGLELGVEAAFPAQELRTPRSTGVTYWEGSVRVRGHDRGQPVAGRGYLEMTGYAGKSLSELFR